MYEFSIEQAANKICEHQTKLYFKEVMSSYFNENYRSATVMLWSVIVCDIIYKLKFLSDIHNDSKARDILAEINKHQTKNPRSSDWESKLITLIKDRTKLFELHEYEFIESIQIHRHYSAHPVLSSTDILFRPTREMVLSDIRAALDYVLTKPAMLTKKVSDALLEDVEENKDVFPTDDSLKIYLNSKYFKNLNDEVRADLFKSLWSITFKSQNEQCDKNRDINYRVLIILFETNRDYLSKYVSQNSDYFSQLSAKPDYVIFFLGVYPKLYEYLTEAAKELIKQHALSDINLTTISHFIAPNIRKHIALLCMFIEKYYSGNFGRNEIEKENIEDLKNIAKCDSAAAENFFYFFLITIYVNSASFDDADWLFSKYIEPFLSEFSKKQILRLIEGIGKNNQTYQRSKAKNDHKLIVARAKELNPNFDITQYIFLPILPIE